MNEPILRLDFQPAFDETLNCPNLHVGRSYESGHKVDYVSVLYCEDLPTLQVGFYVDHSVEFDFTSWSCIWHGWIVAGFGNSIAFVHPQNHATHLFHLDKSFGLTSHFLMMESTGDYLIGVTSCGLIRFNETPEIVWVADDLGTEGVSTSVQTFEIWLTSHPIAGQFQANPSAGLLPEWTTSRLVPN
jgi:hypothetical protein